MLSLWDWQHAPSFTGEGRCPREDCALGRGLGGCREGKWASGDSQRSVSPGVDAGGGTLASAEADLSKHDSLAKAVRDLFWVDRVVLHLRLFWYGYLAGGGVGGGKCRGKAGEEARVQRSGFHW